MKSGSLADQQGNAWPCRFPDGLPPRLERLGRSAPSSAVDRPCPRPSRPNSRGPPGSRRRAGV